MRNADLFARACACARMCAPIHSFGRASQAHSLISRGTTSHLEAASAAVAYEDAAQLPEVTLRATAARACSPGSGGAAAMAAQPQRS